VKAALALLTVALASQADARARDLGIPFEGKPGPLNAITDIRGVEVGQKTLIEGEGALKLGVGPVRTGVTVIFPRGKADARPVYGGFFNLNGNGEMTGRAYLDDFGIVQGPVGITDTNGVGQVYAGIQQFLNILPAGAIARRRRVIVGKAIDDANRGPAAYDRFDVDSRAADRLEWNYLEVL
jgi:L-aminopeptidase/D-esterase-like protein